jgi:hypothetical protein
MSPSTGNCLLPADSAPLFAIVDRSSPGQGWRCRRSRRVRRLPHQRMQQIQHLSERVHIQGSRSKSDSRLGIEKPTKFHGGSDQGRGPGERDEPVKLVGLDGGRSAIGKTVGALQQRGNLGLGRDQIHILVFF